MRFSALWTFFLIFFVGMAGCSHSTSLRRTANPPSPPSAFGPNYPVGYTQRDDAYSWSVITDPVVLGGSDTEPDSDFSDLYSMGITNLDTLTPPDAMAWSPDDWYVIEIYDPYYFDMHLYPKQYTAYRIRKPHGRWGYYDYIHYNMFFYPSRSYAWGWYRDPFWFDRGAVVIYDYPISTAVFFSYWPSIPYAYSPYDYFNPFWGCHWYDPWRPYRVGPWYSYWDPWWPWGYWGYARWWWRPVIIVRPDDHRRPRARQPMMGSRNPEVQRFPDSIKVENRRTVTPRGPRVSQDEAPRRSPTRDGILPESPLLSPDTGISPLSLEERRTLQSSSIGSLNEARSSDLFSPPRSSGAELYISPRRYGDLWSESSRHTVPLVPRSENRISPDIPPLSLPRPMDPWNSNLRDTSAPRFHTPVEPSSTNSWISPTNSTPRSPAYGNMSSPGRSFSPAR